MGPVDVKSDIRVTVIVRAATVIEPPTATARVHHVDGNLIDVRSCHHVDFPLEIDTMALNATLSVSETGSDGTTILGDRYLAEGGQWGRGSYVYRLCCPRA
jgi:hypothetical protein